MNIGNNIYELRKKYGYSQEQLANKCGVSRQAISRWESNEVMPDTNNLLQLSKIFQVTIDELVNNESVKTEETKPDMFDKSVNLISRHWAKVGYYLTGIGTIALILGFSYNLIFNKFMKNLFGITNSIANSAGAGEIFSGMNNTVQSGFNSFAILPTALGVLFIVVGIVLIIVDYKKNHK